MNKKFIWILSIAGMLAGFSACKKCVSCTYTNNTNEQITTNETCGKKKDLENFESDLADTWGEYGDVVCTDK